MKKSRKKAVAGLGTFLTLQRVAKTEPDFERVNADETLASA